MLNEPTPNRTTGVTTSLPDITIVHPNPTYLLQYTRYPYPSHTAHAHSRGPLYMADEFRYQDTALYNSCIKSLAIRACSFRFKNFSTNTDDFQVHDKGVSIKKFRGVTSVPHIN